MVEGPNQESGVHQAISSFFHYCLTCIYGRYRQLGILALLFSFVGISDAKAQVPRPLRPGTRPMAFLFGMGPSMRITNAPASFKLTQEFNGHFSGNASGPALGFILEEEFASRYDRFGLTIAPKFVYDIPVYRPMGIYVSPSVSFGYHLFTCENCRVDHAADLQFGVTAKLILNDRMMVWFQPTNFDLLISSSQLGARYEMLIGGGVTF